MNPQVDLYLEEGCGRCSLYRSPECKVHTWAKELVQLRRIVLDCGLDEDYKWKQPCYTFQGHNVLLVTAFKEYACIAFFKGTLLKDGDQLLTSPGENSQSAKQFRFTNIQQILDLETSIKAYIFESIEIEKAGLKVEFKRESDPVPVELEQRFKEDPGYKKAFEALTPGRKRSYLLHFNQAKQSATRISRIEKCFPKILEGKGWNER